jgi:phage head maturation protease
MVSRGDFSGCSFAFTDEDVELSYDKENHCAHRIVRKIRQLYDTSIVINPAYSATEVAIRQVEEIVDQNERVIEEVTEERSVEEVKVEETITPDDTWKEQLREYKTRLNNL